MGASLAPMLLPGDVISLSGDLGAGKTALVQGIAAASGVNERVTSPSFTIVHEYKGRFPFIHVDVYRLNSFQEVLDLGFEEFLDPEAVVIVEWGDAIAPLLPRRHLEVEIRRVDDDDDLRRGPLQRLRHQGAGQAEHDPHGGEDHPAPGPPEGVIGDDADECHGPEGVEVAVAADFQDSVTYDIVRAPPEAIEAATASTMRVAVADLAARIADEPGITGLTINTTDPEVVELMAKVAGIEPAAAVR
mgnify:CR=1 FL=1